MTTPGPAWFAVIGLTLLTACGETNGASAPGSDGGFGELHDRTPVYRAG